MLLSGAACGPCSSFHRPQSTGVTVSRDSSLKKQLLKQGAVLASEQGHSTFPVPGFAPKLGLQYKAASTAEIEAAARNLKETVDRLQPPLNLPQHLAVKPADAHALHVHMFCLFF